MNVLSLFDGISCGQVALERAGIKIDNYYASEIDKYAIQVAQKNYPNTIQLGDIENIDFNKYIGKIDLLIGGSPCQGFSFAGKQLNFMDPRSRLFFKYVEALETIKPKYFLLENVPMKEWCLDTITKYMGVEPIKINSDLVSAQNRKRFYWTNIPGLNQPQDKKIMLKDIVHENSIVDQDKSYCLDANYWKGGNLKSYFEKHRRQLAFEELTEYIVPFDQTLQILDKEVEKGKIGYFRKDSQANRVYYIHGKAVTLCGEAGGGAAKMGQYLFGCITDNEKKILNYVDGELRVAQATKQGYDVANHGDSINLSLPNSKTRRGRVGKGKSNTLDTQCNQAVYLGSEYLFGCITPDRVNKRQNGQRFNEGNKFYTLTAQDKHGVLIEGYIRKLTPIECERLQTLPDNYTEGISNSQRYKCLGNGWTVDVISHIFSNIPQQQAKAV